MGQGFVTFCRNRIKKTWKVAFFWTFIFGFAAHIYKFTNTLPGHDSLFHQYSDMNIYTSGRWFLSVACAPSGIMDLPWIIGLLSLIYIALTAVVIVDLFKLENIVAIALISGLLVTFPCVTNTFFFEFTADGYLLAMLLAALAVRLIAEDAASPLKMALAAILLCLSCGIYQAYVSFALVLAIIYFIWKLLTENSDDRTLWHWVLKFFIVFALGLALYWGIWKAVLAINHASAVSYNGIDSIGVLDFSIIGKGIKDTVRTLLLFFLYWNVLEHGWTIYAILNVAMLALTVVAIITAVVKSGLYKRPGRLALLIICLLAIPFAVCIWLFVSYGVFYHALMLQSLVLIYVLAVILINKYFSNRCGTIAAALVLILVLKYTAQANMCYFMMDKSYESTRATGIEILTRVHEMDDGHIKHIAFLGSRVRSFASTNAWMLDEIYGQVYQLRTNLVYDNVYGSSYLLAFLDSTYTMVDAEEINALEDSGIAETMDVWPLKDSIKIVGDIAVIKLAELPGE